MYVSYSVQHQCRFRHNVLHTSALPTQMQIVEYQHWANSSTLTTCNTAC